MKKNTALVSLTVGIAILAGCSGKKTTSSTEARTEMESKWAPMVGKATKTEFVEQYGDAEWCKPIEDTGEETCRFYLKKGIKWVGDKKDHKHFEQGDNIVADFDSKGVLKTFKAAAQR